MIITIKFIEAENDPNQKMKIENSQHTSTATIRIGENIENNWLHHKKIIWTKRTIKKRRY